VVVSSDPEAGIPALKLLSRFPENPFAENSRQDWENSI
jgi:hypothetical protein